MATTTTKTTGESHAVSAISSKRPVQRPVFFFGRQATRSLKPPPTNPIRPSSKATQTQPLFCPASNPNAHSKQPSSSLRPVHVIDSRTRCNLSTLHVTPQPVETFCGPSVPAKPFGCSHSPVELPCTSYTAGRCCLTRYSSIPCRGFRTIETLSRSFPRQPVGWPSRRQSPLNTT
ncbi:hypothetical protein LX36DRAFT_453733 [Colletotrichum falcatum]|nr:hypothetical protein LX36DRAFT_453733 [Colletotrichum falcatum]